jgi:hypothetical protein
MNGGEVQQSNPPILNDNERDALRLVSRVLVDIRLACRGPVTPKVVRLIHDLADAVHNIPDVACRKTLQEHNDLKFLMDAGIRRVQETYAAFEQQHPSPGDPELPLALASEWQTGRTPVYRTANVNGSG